MSIATQIQQLLQDKQFELALQLAVSTQKLDFAVDAVVQKYTKGCLYLLNCSESTNESLSVTSQLSTLHKLVNSRLF